MGDVLIDVLAHAMTGVIAADLVRAVAIFWVAVGAFVAAASVTFNVATDADMFSFFGASRDAFEGVVTAFRFFVALDVLSPLLVAASSAVSNVPVVRPSESCRLCLSRSLTRRDGDLDCKQASAATFVGVCDTLATAAEAVFALVDARVALLVFVAPSTAAHKARGELIFSRDKFFGTSLALAEDVAVFFVGVAFGVAPPLLPPETAAVAAWQRLIRGERDFKRSIVDVVAAVFS